MCKMNIAARIYFKVRSKKNEGTCARVLKQENKNKKENTNVMRGNMASRSLVVPRTK